MSSAKLLKCCFFMGIFNSVLYALLTCASLASFIYLIACLLFGTPPDTVYILLGCVVFLLNYGAISFAFSVILVVGIRKKNRKYVEVYLIYDFIVTMLCMTATVVYWVVFKGGQISISAVSLTMCCINLLMSIIALKTYKNFNTVRRPTAENLLITQNQILFIESK